MQKAGEKPPSFSRTALSQTKTCGERPKHDLATSPPSTHPRKAAHQGSGLGVPDLHEVVGRPADDAIAIPRERHQAHEARVTHQGVQLPPAHHFLRQLPRQNLWRTTDVNTLTTSPHSTRSHKAAHQGSGLGVPDLHEVVLRPADDAIAVRRESDGPHGARVTRQGAHLPPTTIVLDDFQRKPWGERQL